MTEVFAYTPGSVEVAHGLLRSAQSVGQPTDVVVAGGEVAPVLDHILVGIDEPLLPVESLLANLHGLLDPRDHTGAVTGWCRETHQNRDAEQGGHGFRLALDVLAVKAQELAIGPESRLQQLLADR